jgi:hypothetical protein
MNFRESLDTLEKKEMFCLCQEWKRDNSLSIVQFNPINTQTELSRHTRMCVTSHLTLSSTASVSRPYNDVIALPEDQIP